MVNNPKIVKSKDVNLQIQNILDKVSSRITPDFSILKDVELMCKEINNLLKKHKISAECTSGGSIAKGTFLKNDYDIDLFVRFNIVYKEQDISQLTQNILEVICKKNNTTLNRIHGSRDYFQFSITPKNKNSKKVKILDFEVIPVIKVHKSSDAINITDLSPEHVVWVRKHIDKNPTLANDIRLAKQFCKANKVYGAESYINGFSGHILDILIIHYGSFVNLLKEFSKYDSEFFKKETIQSTKDKSKKKSNNIIIDPEKKLKNPLLELNESKISPLIIVDPVQDDRNSSAALNLEKLLTFINVAKEFLKNPKEDFFEIKKFDIEKEIDESFKQIKIEYKKNRSDCTITKITAECLDGSKDVVGTKILKMYEAMLSQLELNEFKVLKSNWNFNFDKKKGEIYIITDKNISQEKTSQGPLISMKEDFEKFKQKHKNSKTEIIGNRIYVTLRREFTNPKDFLENLSKKEFISKRAKKIIIQ